MNQLINLLPRPLALAIMTFMYFDPSSLLVQVSLVLHEASLFVHPTSVRTVYPCFVFLRSFLATRCSSLSHLIIRPKKIVLHLLIQFMSISAVSAFRKTALFDFFAFHEIRSISFRNRTSVAFSSFCKYFEIVQAPHTYYGLNNTCSRVLLPVWIEMHWL